MPAPRDMATSWTLESQLHLRRIPPVGSGWPGPLIDSGHDSNGFGELRGARRSLGYTSAHNHPLQSRDRHEGGSRQADTACGLDDVAYPYKPRGHRRHDDRVHCAQAHGTHPRNSATPASANRLPVSAMMASHARPPQPREVRSAQRLTSVPNRLLAESCRVTFRKSRVPTAIPGFSTASADSAKASRQPSARCVPSPLRRTFEKPGAAPWTCGDGGHFPRATLTRPRAFHAKPFTDRRRLVRKARRLLTPTTPQDRRDRPPGPRSK